MTNTLSNQLFNSTLKTLLFCALAGTLSSCQAGNTPSITATVDEKDHKITPFPSVLEVFSCKPANLAFVAAHRGTHEGSDFPENALESLKELHRNGITFAEIDVARINGTTQILYHDGTWDRGSTGSGPIAVSTWAASQKFLLKDTNGNITSFRPTAFADVLTWAHGKMYLEIDFKSSVNEAEVVQAIRSAEMIDQVILISYSADQAVRLHKLAPKAALSVGIFKPGDIKALEVRGIPISVMTAWTGRGPLSQELADSLRAKNIPILAASFFDLDDKLQASGKFSAYTGFAKSPDLVVSDFAFDAQPVLEIKANDLKTYNACISKL